MRRALAALMVAAIGSGCATKKPQARTLENWTPPMPPAEMRMTLFSGATVYAVESDALAGGDPEKKLEMPVVMAFVRHPKGDVLIDEDVPLRMAHERHHHG